MQLARGEVEQAEKEKNAGEQENSSSNESPRELNFRKEEDDTGNNVLCEIDDEVYEKEFIGKEKLKQKLEKNESQVAPLVAALNEDRQYGNDLDKQMKKKMNQQKRKQLQK